MCNFNEVNLGEGTYSKIFKASLKDDPDHKVAIKCISKKKAFGQIEHIAQDVNKLISLNHPNVIRYLELYEDKRTIFIVMEYIEGEILFDVISRRVKNNKVFSEYEAAIIMKKLLQTIDFCHEHHIMHKDIKPNKVLVTSDGEIKLIDFGLSKWKTYGKLHTSSETPFYMAPEVLEGIRTAKSDIWSLGVLLFCLLSGTLPFVRDSNETVYDKIKEGELSFDTRIWNKVSYDAQDLLTKMIDREYQHRYDAKECLGHEWFAIALSEESKQSSLNFTDIIPTNLLAFKRKCELENAVASIIHSCIKPEERHLLTEKFNEVSVNADHISSSDLCNSVCDLNASIDKKKLEGLAKALENSKNQDDKIFYRNILHEMEMLTKVKKLAQIKMVFYQF